MKKVYIILSSVLMFSAVHAKTYTVSSGKWSDASVWGGQCIGNVIKAEDEVIVTGQITMTDSLVVEGTLQVKSDAGMVGMKDLMIAKGGKFINSGNTVMKRIINEGSIKNNRVMEAMMDIENKGTIENDNMITGENFENFGGNAAGSNGAYYVSNNISSSPASKFGSDVKVFTAAGEAQSSASAMMLNAEVNFEAVVLNVSNPAKKDVSVFSVEKSSDGTNYTLLEMIPNNKESETAMSYTDLDVSNKITYYRVTALTVGGDQTVLPIAAVKVPVNGYALAK